ncbi:MAG: hypothetical protein K8J08_04130 [Thermoanaerobaculia bacterium]|nr:hypothetical protein [Thermoanaerobaculia bacterium]
MHPRPRLTTTALLLLTSLLAVSGAPLLAGIWGAHDPVPAATLLVPFFEVGINQGTDPQNTNINVTTQQAATIHWEVWNIDGVRSDALHGNVVLSSEQTWSTNLAALIAADATPDDVTRLTQGNFFRGFMTIDVVTSATDASPFEAGYPFGTSNVITGNIYYLRLAEGSANGLPMVGLEYTSETANSFLEGFYGNGDGREEIDENARACAATLSHDAGPCVTSDLEFSSISARVFQSAALSGDTRVVVFTWTTSMPEGGGPSVLCAGTCTTIYSARQYRENGELVTETLIELPHVVNILETAGPNPGKLVLLGLEDPDESMQTYGFSINSASPQGNPNINWDAIFEATVAP